jgi:hypothetical protein
MGRQIGSHCHTQIGHHEAPVGCPQNVLGFHVAVDDPRLVNCCDAIDHRPRIRQSICQRATRASGVQCASQGAPRRELHGQEAPTVVLEKIEDLADVRVLYPPRMAKLATEVLDPVTGGGTILVEDLDGDGLFGDPIEGAVDGGHSARAE